MPLKRKLVAYLQLIRLPNLLTIPGDVLIGGFLATTLPMYTVKSEFSFGTSLSILALISLLLYSFGLVQNDLFGLKEDLALNRKRPLTTNAISLLEAKTLALFLLIGAIASAFLINKTALVITFVLIALVTLYNFLNQKGNGFAPVVMGLCRGVNILLGASLVGGELFQLDPYNQYLWICAAFHIVYILAVTFFARNEATTGPKNWAKLFPFLVTLIFSLLITNFYLGLFSVITLLTTLPILKKSTPKEIGQTVGHFIQNLILLQLFWLMLIGVNWGVILMVVVFYFLHGQLSKWFYTS